jgi:short-subunit dehydrogenase
MRASDKVIVVTGASMGIGEAIARLFAAEGAGVVWSSRDLGRAEAARQRSGYADHGVALACDVRDPEQIQRTVDETMARFGRIDVWVNNAGHGIKDSIERVDMGLCRTTFEANFFGALIAMQKVIPVMRRQGGGAIINISSVAGHIPLAFSGVYSATKFAMNAMGKAARIELRGAGINVLTVCPGHVQTNFGENTVYGHEVRIRRSGSVKGISAERVARATFEGWRRGKREVVVPWTMIPTIKLYQLFPWVVERAMGRMARSSKTDAAGALN